MTIRFSSMWQNENERISKECDELKALLENTFNMCTSTKDEYYWLISILRGLMNVPNKKRDSCLENFKINAWQLKVHPHIERYKKKWHHSNYYRDETSE